MSHAKRAQQYLLLRIFTSRTKSTTDRGVTALAASVLQRFLSASDTGTLFSNLAHKDRLTADPQQKKLTRSAKRSSFFHRDQPYWGPKMFAIFPDINSVTCGAGSI